MRAPWIVVSLVFTYALYATYAWETGRMPPPLPLGSVAEWAQIPALVATIVLARRALVDEHRRWQQDVVQAADVRETEAFEADRRLARQVFVHLVGVGTNAVAAPEGYLNGTNARYMLVNTSGQALVDYSVTCRYPYLRQDEPDGLFRLDVVQTETHDEKVAQPRPVPLNIELGPSGHRALLVLEQAQREGVVQEWVDEVLSEGDFGPAWELTFKLAGRAWRRTSLDADVQLVDG